MNKTPLAVRVIGGLGVLFYAIGTNGFLQSLMLTPEDLQQLPETSRLMMERMPAWLPPVALTSLGAGLAGSASMIIGRRLAFPLLALSFLTNILYIYAGFIVEAHRLFGWGAMVMQVAGLAICGGFTLLARWSVRRQWLR